MSDARLVLLVLLVVGAAACGREPIRHRATFELKPGQVGEVHVIGTHVAAEIFNDGTTPFTVHTTSEPIVSTVDPGRSVRIEHTEALHILVRPTTGRARVRVASEDADDLAIRAPLTDG